MYIINVTSLLSFMNLAYLLEQALKSVRTYWIEEKEMDKISRLFPVCVSKKSDRIS